MSVAALVNGSIASKSDETGIIKLAVMAVGGQGGGVLTNWILDVAESNGYVAQATSVPGVAQRTGATIYYIEMLPEAAGQPVLALMPSPGDVDIVIAAELMEAGRAVTRGLVTPDRTTMIASSHRMYAVSEKIVPGDGVVGANPVRESVSKSAKRMLCHDLSAVAEEHGAHISASLFGALAGSGALPFSREQFEATIRQSGRGVEASLKAFAGAHALSSGKVSERPALANPAPKPTTPLRAGADLLNAWQVLSAKVNELPSAAQTMARAGLRNVVDYQDVAYGEEYLRLLETAAAQDRQHSGESHNFAFTVALAKHLANAMCYDDVIRVADLKTRSTRITRVRDDVDAEKDDVIRITEYMHPRADEVVATMPARMARFVEKRRWLYAFIEGRCRKGRRWRSDAMFPFLVFYMLGGLRRWRRSLLRHERETTHREAWLNRATATLSKNYPLAVEVLNTRRLIKGYSDTHARGLSKFDRVLDGIALVEDRPDAVDWAKRLMAAALAKAEEDDIDGVIMTIRSFASEQNDKEKASAPAAAN